MRVLSLWLVFEDFNEIVSHREKQGGWLRPEWQLEDFKETQYDCELFDMGFTRCSFT